MPSVAPLAQLSDLRFGPFQRVVFLQQLPLEFGAFLHGSRQLLLKLRFMLLRDLLRIGQFRLHMLFYCRGSGRFALSFIERLARLM